MFPQMVRRKRRVQEGRQCPVSHIGFGVPHSLDNGRRLAAIVRIAIIKSLLLLLFLGFVVLLVSIAPSLLSFGSFFPHDCADVIKQLICLASAEEKGGPSFRLRLVDVLILLPCLYQSTLVLLNRCYASCQLRPRL